MTRFPVRVRSSLLGLAAAAVAAALAMAPAGRAAAAPAPGDVAALDQTLQALRDAVVAEGPSAMQASIQDTATGQTWVNNRRREWSAFVLDPAGCGFSFHYRMLDEGEVKVDHDGGVPLADVRTIEVGNLDDVMRKVDAQGGHPTWVTHNQPTIWRVNVVRADASENAFYFYDLDHARRVAALFKRAAELCGAEGVQLD